jgi:hypothetical protein
VQRDRLESRGCAASNVNGARRIRVRGLYRHVVSSGQDRVGAFAARRCRPWMMVAHGRCPMSDKLVMGLARAVSAALFLGLAVLRWKSWRLIPGIY